MLTFPPPGASPTRSPPDPRPQLLPVASSLSPEYALPIMPNIERHAPGEFCWVELATTNQAAAQAFYAQIFGWSAKNMPTGPDEVYTIFQLEGRDVAAGCALRPDQ